MELRWSESLAVGISEIDAQHRELFRRASVLVSGAGSAAELAGLVHFLHEYAVVHFGLEEDWMRDTRYPGYARHKAEHDRFISDLLAFADEHARFTGRPATFANRLAEWLGAWLGKHVTGTDAELGRFLAKRRA